MIWSKPLLARVWLSGLKATVSTQSVCPANVLIHLPVLTSHNFRVLSPLPLTIVLPSGLNATAQTDFVCPLKVRQLPVLTSHSLTVESEFPLARSLPQGL